MVNHSLPTAGEDLAAYIKRLRLERQWTQVFLATKAGLHPQSLRKLEREGLQRLNRKTKTGLARALDIPEDYLEAALRGVAVTEIQALKFCPRCWQPGTPLEQEWSSQRAVFCFTCGEKLCDRCLDCGAAFQSSSHRFCPHCGGFYRRTQEAQ